MKLYDNCILGRKYFFLHFFFQLSLFNFSGSNSRKYCCEKINHQFGQFGFQRFHLLEEDEMLMIVVSNIVFVKKTRNFILDREIYRSRMRE
jgi:hypothetical protein